MKLSKRITWLKYIVYFYIVILGLTGFFQIGFGAILFWDHIAFNILAENNFWKPAALLIGVGVGNLILGWLGCSSTANKNRCSMGLFSSLIIVSIGVQLFIAYWSHKLRLSLLKSGSENFEYTLDDSFDTFFKDFKYVGNHAWNRMEEEYKCCGVDGLVNYRHLQSVPWSCLDRSAGRVSDTNVNTVSEYKIHSQGCLEALTNLLRTHLLYCAYGALITTLIQSFGLFCTILLIIWLKRERSTSNSIEVGSGGTDTVDINSKAFRHKFESDLSKSLSERRSLRKSKLNGEGSTLDI